MSSKVRETNRRSLGTKDTHEVASTSDVVPARRGALAFTP